MTNEEWRNHRYYKIDPFAGEIPPALLNSADIMSYVCKGCLIKKEDFDPKNCLKPASYEMKFLGKLYDWNSTDDEKLEQCCREVCRGSKITLHANSITYLWMKEELMLPQYIAARFNLHIRHVHKGILLGTGPLVDPGFFGKLLIPLHNLTNNKYELKGGEGIIWVEFTKISEHKFWNRKKWNQTENENRDNPPDLYPFPETKDVIDPDIYFTKSGVYKKCGVQSAFKGSLDSARTSAKVARKSADDAREEIEQFNKQFRKFGWIATVIGGVTILLTIAGVWLTGHSLISDTVSRVQDSRDREISAEIEKQDDKLKKFEADLEDVKAHLMEVSESLNELNRQIDKPNNIKHHNETSLQR